MLGHRGCRLGISYPEISEMQCRAIFEAACKVQKAGTPVKPEIMIPLVGGPQELQEQKTIVDRVAQEVFAETGVKVEYQTGTMIELPRACVVADQIAKVGEFFSFGTNDLTQTTFGFSRDDAGKFIADYIARGILKVDPFQALDQEGVGSSDENGMRKGAKRPPENQAGYLRRTRRRAVLGGVLPSNRIGLRQLFALSRADRTARSRSSSYCG